MGTAEFHDFACKTILTLPYQKIACVVFYFSQCVSSFCLPRFMVCNRIADCSGGDDEQNCCDMTCVGLLLCRFDLLCVHPLQICDRNLHCPISKDDENMCGPWQCPHLYKCFGYTVKCVGKLPEDNVVHLRSKAVIFKNLTITAVFTLSTALNLLYIDLGGCSFSDNIVSNGLFERLRVLQ